MENTMRRSDEGLRACSRLQGLFQWSIRRPEAERERARQGGPTKTYSETYDEVAATEEGAAISSQAGPRLCKDRRQNTMSSDAVSRVRSRPKPGSTTGRGPPPGAPTEIGP